VSVRAYVRVCVCECAGVGVYACGMCACVCVWGGVKHDEACNRQGLAAGLLTASSRELLNCAVRQARIYKHRVLFLAVDAGGLCCKFSRRREEVLAPHPPPVLCKLLTPACTETPQIPQYLTLSYALATVQ